MVCDHESEEMKGSSMKKEIEENDGSCKWKFYGCLD
jgi:hypothetical protein